MIRVSMPENIVLLLLTLTFSNHFLQRFIPALKGWRQMHCAFPWFSGLEQSGRFRRRLLLLRSLSAVLVDTRVDACSFWASHSQMRAKSNIVAVFLNDTIIALFCRNEVVFYKLQIPWKMKPNLLFVSIKVSICLRTTRHNHVLPGTTEN